MTNNNENVNNCFRQDSESVVLNEEITFKDEVIATIHDPNCRRAILFVERLYEIQPETVFDELVQKNQGNVERFEKYLPTVKANFLAGGYNYRSALHYSVYLSKLEWFLRRRGVQAIHETCLKEMKLAFATVKDWDGMETLQEIIQEYANEYLNRVEENEQHQIPGNHRCLKSFYRKKEVVDDARKTENEVVKQQSCHPCNNEVMNKKRKKNDPVLQRFPFSDKSQIPCSESETRQIDTCSSQNRDSCVASSKDCTPVSGTSTDIKVCAGCPYLGRQSIVTMNSTMHILTVVIMNILYTEKFKADCKISNH